jgi:capsular polysaccharide biosynthesis protein
MLAEVDPKWLDEALEHFKQAQEIAFDAFVSTRNTLQGKFVCEDSALVLDWTAQKNIKITPIPSEDGIVDYGRTIAAHVNAQESVSIDLQYRERPVYLAKFKKVGISGYDGLIVDRKAPACNIYVPSAQHFLQLTKNIQMLATWTGSGKPSWHDYHKGSLPMNGASFKVTPLNKAASIMQYTTTSYYHWLLESLGRLVLLRPFLEKHLDVQLVVPVDKTANRYITNYLQLILPDFDSRRYVEYDPNGPNDFRIDVKVLYYVVWQQPESSTIVHCLPPRSVLRRIRSALVPTPPVVRDKIIYTTRKADKMRKITSEALLLQQLQVIASEFSLELVEFSGLNHTASDTISVFSQAVAVVGVHGGALSNAVFCSPSTLLVEFGFRSPVTRHYAHLAQALDLAYELVFLDTDERSVGGFQVDIDEAIVNSLVPDLIRKHLRATAAKDEL